MHRFVWPLHYALPPALTEGRRRRGAGDGVWAPPGRYTVVLDVDGVRHTQPLTVLPDPRLTLHPEDFAKQFALARRIEDARAQAATLGHENDALLKALAERKKGAKAETVKAMNALQARASEILGTPPTGGPPSLPALTSLRTVSDTLDKLAYAVDGADSAPTPDAITGFEKVQPLLATVQTAWTTLKTKDLAALNARLKKSGQAAIALEHDDHDAK